MLSDKTTSCSPEDIEMEAAIRNAKESVGQFLKTFFSRTERQKSFLLKVVFVEGGQAEHIWLADLVFSGNASRGVVANEPRLSSLKFMQTVEFEPSQITDWMYVEDGYLVGGYTTRLIRERITPSDRKAFDASTPYKFRELA
jgi:uncharacterized protein YegJ (DUF2314 family)